MKTFVTAVALAAALVAGVAFTDSANAAEHYLKLQPSQKLEPLNDIPRLGIYSQFIYGQGVRVTGVLYGSEAARLGIEERDTVVGIDGYLLDTPNAWHNILAYRLANSGGNTPMLNSNTVALRLQPEVCHHDVIVTLYIRDWRTGQIATRTTNLANW
ncbi:MAG: hypothetical protein KDA41_10925 [Planctomycetales bacterium]|nr:hypothetical protein [Planctomycetales bacterium]